MFDRLKSKWKVNTLQLIVILCTFTIGGSFTGYVGRKLLNLLSIDNQVIWVILYIITMTVLWPIMVLIVSIPLGQFGFFKKYIQKIFRRMGIIK